jgi:O-antigen/teichoic acid export membrane protein
VLLILTLLPLIGALEFLPAARLEREGRFRTIAAVGMVRHLTSTVLTVALAFAGYSYLSMAYGSLAGAMVSLTAMNLVGRQFVSFRLRLAEWRRILQFATHMLAISGVNAAAGRLTELILGQTLGLAALGLYGRASTLNNLLWENIHMVIGRVLLVDFSRRKQEGQSLREAYIRTVDLLTALLWPAFAGLAVLAGPLIQIVYGERWVAAAAPLSMMALAAIVLVSITQTWEIFVVSRETGRQARLEVVRTGFGLVLFTLGCLVNLTVAAASRIGEAIFSLILYRPHLSRMTETRTADFLAIYLRSGLLTLAAVGPALSLMLAHGWSPAVPPAQVALAILAGVAAWTVLVEVLRHPLRDEARRLLRRGAAPAPAARLD